MNADPDKNRADAKTQGSSDQGPSFSASPQPAPPRNPNASDRPAPRGTTPGPGNGNANINANVKTNANSPVNPKANPKGGAVPGAPGNPRVRVVRWAAGIGLVLVLVAAKPVFDWSQNRALEQSRALGFAGFPQSAGGEPITPDQWAGVRDHFQRYPLDGVALQQVAEHVRNTPSSTPNPPEIQAEIISVLQRGQERFARNPAILQGLMRLHLNDGRIRDAAKDAGSLAVIPEFRLENLLPWLERIRKGCRTPLDQLALLEVIYQASERGGGGGGGGKTLTPEILRMGVELAVPLGRFEIARPWLNVLREKLPKDPDVMYLTGQCQAGLNQRAEAEDLFRMALETKPDHFAAAGSLAELLRGQEGREQEADQIWDDLVRQFPRDSSVWIARGRYRQTHQLAGWDKDFSAAARLAPDSADTLVEQGALLIPSGDASASASASAYEAAVAHWNKARERFPQDLRMDLGLSDAFIQAGKYREALQVLAAAEARESEKKTPQMHLSWKLMELQIILKEYDNARKTWANFEDKWSNAGGAAGREYPVAFTDLVEAKILIHQEKWNEAVLLLNRILPGLVAKPVQAADAAMLLASAYESLGRNDLKRKAAFQAVGFQPQSLPAQTLVISALEADGQFDEALAQTQQLVKEQPQALPLLGRLVLWNVLNGSGARVNRKEIPEDLITNLQKQLKERFPQSEVTAALEIAGKLSRGQIPAAEVQLRQTLREHPQTADYWKLAVLLPLRQKNFAQAEQQWRLAVQTLQSPNALVDLTWFYGTLAPKSRGTEVLSQLAADLLPATNAPATNVPATKPTAGNAPATAPAAATPPAPALSLRKGLDKLPEDQRGFIVARICTHWLSLGQIAVAQPFVDRLAAMYPKRVEILVMQAEIATRTRNLEALAAVTESLKTLEGAETGSWWRAFAILSALIQQQNGDKSAGEKIPAELDLLEKARPDWSLTHRLRGDAARALRNPDRAINYYRKAYQLGDHTPSLLRDLSGLYLADGRSWESAQLLKPWLSDGVDLPTDLRRSALETLVLEKDAESANLWVQKLESLPAAALTPELQIIWGRLQTLLGQTREAELRLQAAIPKTVGESIDVRLHAWSALIELKIRLGRVDQAQRVLAQARQALPSDDPRVRETLALRNEQLEPPATQLQRLQARLTLEPQSPRARLNLARHFLAEGEWQSAAPLLRQCLTLPQILENATPADRSQARRWLAAIVLDNQAAANPQARDEALQLIAANLKDGNGSSDDQRIQIRLLALDPKRQAEALSQLESLQQAGLGRPDDSLILNKILIDQGEYAQAETQLRSLAAAIPASAETQRAAAIRRLLIEAVMAKNPAGQDEALILIEKNLASPWRTPEDQLAKARILAAKPKSRPEALRVLETGFASAPIPGEAALLLGKLLEAECRFPEARQHYQKWIRDGRTQNLDAAGKALRIGVYLDAMIRWNLAQSQRAELMPLLEEFEKLQPNTLSGISLKIQLLHIWGNTAEARALTESLRNNPKVNPVTLADLWERINLPALAEPILRAVAKQPRTTPNANNANNADTSGGKSEPNASATETSLPASAQVRRNVNGLATITAESVRSQFPLILFLARQQRAGEALDLLEPITPQCDAGTLSLLVNSLVSTQPPPQPAVLERVETWLRTWLENTPISPELIPLWTSLALTLEARGNLDEAEYLYHQVLKLDPLNFIALNNLVYLIALRPDPAAAVTVNPDKPGASKDKDKDNDKNIPVTREARLKEAKQLLTRATDKYGISTNLLDTRAMFFLASGKESIPSAVSDLKRITWDPLRYAPHYHLSQALLASGDRAGAAAALKTALSNGLEAKHLHFIEKTELAKLKKTLGL